MTSYALTEAGAADKIKDLYALSDPALALEATAIAADFKEWLKNNFNLTSQQATYINGINNAVASYWGSQCAVCFLFRRPITLIYPTPPLTPGYTKWSGDKSSLAIMVNGSGKVIVTGSLTFTISYEEN